jgi:hypothetical protein
MNPFSQFERLAERIFEQDLPRVLGGRLDPLELTRAIDRALDALPRDAPPPAALRLEVGEGAARALAGRTAAVEAELSRYAGARLRERWPGERPDPVVRLTVAADLAGREARGAVDLAGVEAGHTAALPPLAPAAAPVRAVVFHADRAIPIARLPCAIGRALDNDVVLDDRSVSRYHAQIRAERGGLIVVDLQSTNGTFLNGRRVAGEARLKDGDSLTIGRAPLRLQLERRQ